MTPYGDPGDYKLSGAPLASSLTAFAGGGQASATALVASKNIVSTCATNADSVKLPAYSASLIGTEIFVSNESANTLAVFPASGDSINAASTDASVNIATKLGRRFILTAANHWVSFLAA